MGAIDPDFVDMARFIEPFMTQTKFARASMQAKFDSQCALG